MRCAVSKMEGWVYALLAVICWGFEAIIVKADLNGFIGGVAGFVSWLIIAGYVALDILL